MPFGEPEYIESAANLGATGIDEEVVRNPWNYRHVAAPVIASPVVRIDDRISASQATSGSRAGEACRCG